MTGILAAAILALAQPRPEAPPMPTPILITGGHLLSPDASRWLDNQSILIDGDRITQIAPAGTIPAPPRAHQINASNLYIIPGLIDLHTHLLLHPYNETPWNDQVLKESLESRTIRATVHAWSTALAGFTTIRDLGTEGAGVADVALRDSINQGFIVGPRIFASTRAIVATGCYGPPLPTGNDPRWNIPRGAQEANGPDEVRRAVREQISQGADWVKLYADYRRAPGSPATATFTLEELKAGVDEARSAGKPIAAHATTDEGIRRAVLAGVNTIEHGYGASRETLQLMKDHNVVLVPTMAAAEAIAIYSGWKPDQPPPPSLKASRDTVRLAHEMGLTIAFGTDAGVFAHGANAREFILMSESGLSPAECLRSATITAAQVLHRDDLGRLAPGAAGDVVLLRADPLASPDAESQVAAVICRGGLVLDRSAPPHSMP